MTTEDDYKLALRIQHWTQQGKPPIRGAKVHPVPADDDDGDDDIPGEGGNHSDTDSSTHEMDISASMSQAAQNILGQDVLATQQSQSNDVQVLTKSSDHKYQVLVGKVQSLWKLLEDDDDDVCYQTVLDAIDKMTMDKVAQAAASKDVDERTQGSDGFDFTETGTYRQQTIRRKKGPC